MYMTRIWNGIDNEVGVTAAVVGLVRRAAEFEKKRYDETMGESPLSFYTRFNS
jgi:hypothetical protein